MSSRGAKARMPIRCMRFNIGVNERKARYPLGLMEYRPQFVPGA